MIPGGSIPSPGPWEARPEPSLPGLPPSTRYVVVNARTGEEHGRPKPYAAATAQAAELNREKKTS